MHRADKWREFFKIKVANIRILSKLTVMRFF